MTIDRSRVLLATMTGLVKLKYGNQDPAIWEMVQEAETLLAQPRPNRAPTDRKPPELFSDEEKKSILSEAENLWRDLEKNKLGGYSDQNRPFYILHAFKEIIERYGHRDVGLSWSQDELDAIESVGQFDGRMWLNGKPPGPSPELLSKLKTGAEDIPLLADLQRHVDDIGHTETGENIRFAIDVIKDLAEKNEKLRGDLLMSYLKAPSPEAQDMKPLGYITPAGRDQLKLGIDGQPIHKDQRWGCTVAVYADPSPESHMAVIDPAVLERLEHFGRGMPKVYAGQPFDCDKDIKADVRAVIKALTPAPKTKAE